MWEVSVLMFLAAWPSYGVGVKGQRHDPVLIFMVLILILAIYEYIIKFKAY